MNVLARKFLYHFLGKDIIFETLNKIDDDLLGYMEISNFLFIQENNYYGPFINFIQKENIIEFETLNNNFIQFDLIHNIWKTTSKNDSLIIKRDIQLDEVMLKNQQIIFHHYTQQIGLT